MRIISATLVGASNTCSPTAQESSVQFVTIPIHQPLLEAKKLAKLPLDLRNREVPNLLRNLRKRPSSFSFILRAPSHFRLTPKVSRHYLFLHLFYLQQLNTLEALQVELAAAKDLLLLNKLYFRDLVNECD